MKKLLKRCNKGINTTYSEWCSINSYKGWTKHCNVHNLNKKYIFPLHKYEEKLYKELFG